MQWRIAEARSGAPVEGCRVSWGDLSTSVLSDGDGKFQLPADLEEPWVVCDAAAFDLTRVAKPTDGWSSMATIELERCSVVRGVVKNVPHDLALTYDLSLSLSFGLEGDADLRRAYNRSGRARRATVLNEFVFERPIDADARISVMAIHKFVAGRSKPLCTVPVPRSTDWVEIDLSSTRVPGFGAVTTRVMFEGERPQGPFMLQLEPVAGASWSPHTVLVRRGVPEVRHRFDEVENGMYVPVVDFFAGCIADPEGLWNGRPPKDVARGVYRFDPIIVNGDTSVDLSLDATATVRVAVPMSVAGDLKRDKVKIFVYDSAGNFARTALLTEAPERPLVFDDFQPGRYTLEVRAESQHLKSRAFALQLESGSDVLLDAQMLPAHTLHVRADLGDRDTVDVNIRDEAGTLVLAKTFGPRGTRTYAFVTDGISIVEIIDPQTREPIVTERVRVDGDDVEHTVVVARK